MPRACANPRVLLLAGSVEFARTNTMRLASFDTLMEQEQKYTQILVEKIVRLRPDLLLVGQAISRQAQEYLAQHRVVVMQVRSPPPRFALSRARYLTSGRRASRSTSSRG